MVLTVLFTEVIYGISSDLPYMGRGIFRRGRCMVSLLAGRAGVAKPNVRARGTGSVLKSGIWRLELRGDISWRLLI